MKKLLVCVLAAVLALSMLTACGKGKDAATDTDTENVAVGALSVATIGEARALETNEEQSAFTDKVYIYAFELDGVYWRLTADLTAEQSEALWALDITDEDYDARLGELVAPLIVTNCENLNPLKLSEDEMKALEGKTGEELLNDGFVAGMYYNLDSMEFGLERAPFAYTVVFEAGEQLENTDDFDVEEAIKPLKVRSVSFDGFAQSVTDVPQDGEEPADDTEVTETDYLVLVNKQNKLPANWEDVVELEDAQNTIPEGVELNEDNDYLASDVFQVEKSALEAFRALQEDLEDEGIIILLDSTYRSVARQEELWEEFVEKYGLEYTQNTVAVPGTSEHHTGLAIDVCIVKDGVVINENDDMIAEREIFGKIHAKLADYGFILRFPENGKAITGYDYEPWHFRYVGVDAAKEIAAQGVTLEEYLGKLPEAAE